MLRLINNLLKTDNQRGESQIGESQIGESQIGESQKGESQKGESQRGESQRVEFYQINKIDPQYFKDLRAEISKNAHMRQTCEDRQKLINWTNDIYTKLNSSGLHFDPRIETLYYAMRKDILAGNYNKKYIISNIDTYNMTNMNTHHYDNFERELKSLYISVDDTNIFFSGIINLINNPKSPFYGTYIFFRRNVIINSVYRDNIVAYLTIQNIVSNDIKK